MCVAPKAPKAPPQVIDTTEAVQENRMLRRRRRGYLSSYKSGFSGDQSAPNLAAKELLGQ